MGDIPPFDVDMPAHRHSAYIETYPRKDGLYDWRLVAGNGEVVCQSTQGFTSRVDAARGAETAMDLMIDEPTYRAVDL